MSVELGGALGSVGARAASAAFAAAPSALGGPTGDAGLVDIVNDGGEVAIADPGLAATRLDTEPALGVAEVLERIRPIGGSAVIKRSPRRRIGGSGCPGAIRADPRSRAGR